MQLERIDPRDLDLDTADEMAEVERAWLTESGLPLPRQSGPSKLKALQHGSDGRPSAGLWLAREGAALAGYVVAHLPVEDNTDSAHLRGVVHPSFRRQGTGRALVDAAVDLAHSRGRTKVYAGAFRADSSGKALEAMGFSSHGLGTNAIRRVDLHATPPERWQRLYDEASAHATDYELTHQVGPTPDELLADMVTLHAAINDAPLDDPEAEDDHWDVDRVRAYDRAMAARRQTVHRVLARHRTTGEWAGLSILCIDEFSPAIAFQEDTSVVRTHRGHRLGQLMKADMLRRINYERPEVAATDTWNATSNHHMIAVNERLGATVVAEIDTYRLRTERP
ncbi:MAG TPA: GNAT family N-acetyltransferase [Nocardioidaceae bacterium]